MKTTFYQVAAWCAALSAITTIGIHSFLKSPASFEESLEVYKTGAYIFSKWWVILHCLFVIISIYALTYHLNERKIPFAKLGFVFYAAFGFLEIVRMFLVLTYLRQLRDQYLGAADDALRDVVRVSIDSFTGIGNMLFSTFTLAILLGNLLIGWACLYEKGRVRYLGLGLVIWGLVLVISLANESLNVGWITAFVGVFSLVFQPIIRLALGVVLFDLSRTTDD